MKDIMTEDQKKVLIEVTSLPCFRFFLTRRVRDAVFALLVERNTHKSKAESLEDDVEIYRQRLTNSDEVIDSLQRRLDQTNRSLDETDNLLRRECLARQKAVVNEQAARTALENEQEARRKVEEDYCWRLAAAEKRAADLNDKLVAIINYATDYKEPMA